MANERLPREQREGMSKGEVGWTGIGITLGVKRENVTHIV